MEHVPNSKHLKYGYKKAHIFTPTQDIYETVNIWNIGIYNWTYYIKPFTEHVPNSEHLNYGYKKAHIFTLPQGYICEKVNIWNIAI